MISVYNNATAAITTYATNCKLVVYNGDVEERYNQPSLKKTHVKQWTTNTSW